MGGLTEVAREAHIERRRLRGVPRPQDAAEADVGEQGASRILDAV